MSTNAVIRVSGFKQAEVYKHWDGYPDAMLPWLQEFNREFSAQRGDDPSYKFAQLLRSSAFDSEKFNLDDSRSTGWGVFAYDTHHYEYLYLLHGDGTVSVVEGSSDVESDDE